MTAALEGGEWSAARPGCTLPPGKTRYPFYRRLGRPQGWSGRAENLVPTGIRSRTVQPIAQSLYRLSYQAHTPWYSTQAIPRRSLHSKRHNILQYTITWNLTLEYEKNRVCADFHTSRTVKYGQKLNYGPTWSMANSRSIFTRFELYGGITWE